MKKKKFILLSGLILSMFAIGTSFFINANSNFQFTEIQASITPYVLTVNKDTVHNDKWWLGSYVYTSNNNTVSFDTTNGTGDEIYSFNPLGGGAGTTSPIQGIQSISVTYQLPSDDLLAGALDLSVGDSTPAYNASYKEEFDLTNTTVTKQTQVFNVSDPSQCHYLNFWYTASGSDNALIFEIIITYQCA